MIQRFKIANLFILSILTINTIFAAELEAPVPEMVIARTCAAYLTRPPVLRNDLGEPIEISEGDWAPFLDKTLTLKDGTVITYREFDRLGANFWQHHREDWEAVARQISDDVAKEFDSRGIQYSRGSYQHEGMAPYNRFTIHIGPSKSNVLGQISQSLVNSGNSVLKIDPAEQMGIVQGRSSVCALLADCSTTPPSNTILLSWLGMDSTQISYYMNRTQFAHRLIDQLVLLRAYFAGETGYADLGSIEITGGSFQNEWASRQDRRGSRAFRLPKDFVLTGASFYSRKSEATVVDDVELRRRYEVLRNEELNLAEEIKKALIALITNPKSQEAHENLAYLIVNYLEATGIPTDVEIKPGQAGAVIVIKPTSEANWRALYQDSMTLPNPEIMVLGSTERPELVALSENMAQRGYRTTFHTGDLFDPTFGVSIDSLEMRIHFSDIFRVNPLEEAFISNPQILAALPGGANRSDNAAVALAWQFVSSISMARTVIKEAQQIQAARMSIAGSDWHTLMGAQGRTLDQLITRARWAHSVILALPGATSNPEVLAVLNLLSVSSTSDGDEILHYALSEVELAHEGIQEASITANILTREELVAFIEVAKTTHDAKLASLDEMVASHKFYEYFERRFDNPYYWTTTEEIRTDDKKLKKFIEDAKVVLQEDREALVRLIAQMRPIILGNPEPLDTTHGHFIVWDYFDLVAAAAKKYPDVVEVTAKEYIAHSQSNNVSRNVMMRSLDLLGIAGAQDDETYAILVREVKSEVRHVARWAGSSLAKLFPERAVTVLAELIVSPNLFVATAAVDVLKGAKLYSEQSLLNSVAVLRDPPEGGKSSSSDNTVTTSANYYVIGVPIELRTQAVIDAVRSAIIYQINKGEKNPYFLFQVARALEVKGDNLEAALITYLTSNPFVGNEGAELLYSMSPNHPLVIANFKYRIAGANGHAWSTLTLLDQLSWVEPNSRELQAGIDKLIREISKANYSGFDHALFREVQRRAGRTVKEPEADINMN